MNSLQKIKKVYDLISNIDFEVTDNTITIKTDKDLLLQTNGNFVNHSTGYNVTFGSQIHLNPKLDNEQSTNMNSLSYNIEQARIKELKRAQNILEHFAKCECDL